jgi:hypothetical protein
MKTKIISLSILLMGLIVGCGLFNTNSKFNPGSLNGVYTFLYNVPVVFPPNDSMPWCENGCYGHDWYIDYISVDYPLFYVCHSYTGTDGEFIDPLTKEKVKVTHIDGNYYKLKKVNGDETIQNIKYKIKKDTVSGLFINKIKNGKEHYGPYFKYVSKPPDKKYLKCKNNASDTTDIFPSWLKYGVNPNQ